MTLISGPENFSTQFTVDADGLIHLTTDPFAKTGGQIDGNVYIMSAGKLGIGTTSPAAPVHIVSASSVEQLDTMSSAGVGFTSQLFFRRAEGTPASPSATLNGDFLFQVVAQGYGATGWRANSSLAIRGVAAENFSDTTGAADIAFLTAPPGTGPLERVRISNTGNLGIGLTNPQTLLHVYGTSNPTSVIDGPGNTAKILQFRTAAALRWSLFGTAGESSGNVGGDLQFNSYDDAGSFLGNPFYIQRSTGNVGINTLDPSVAMGDTGAGTTLAVRGVGATAYGMMKLLKSTTGSGANGEMGRITFGSPAYTSSEKRTAIIRSLSETAATDNPTGNLGFWTTNAATIGERMRITGAGNVGIGTTAPPSKLVVSNNVTQAMQAGLTGTVMQIVGADATNTRLAIDQYGSGTAALDLRKANGTAASLSPVLNNDTVGAVSALGWDGSTFTGAAGAQLYFVATEDWNGTSHGGALAFRTTTNGTAATAERMRLSGAGNLGIGTTVPGSPLHIVSASSIAQLDTMAAAAYSQLFFRRAEGTPASPTAVLNGDMLFQIMAMGYGTTGWRANNSVAIRGIAAETFTDSTSGADLAFLTAQTSVGGGLLDRVRITAGGNVGIGTTAPQSKLVVTSNASGLAPALPGSIPTTMQVIGADAANALFAVQAYGSTAAIDLFRFNGTAASPSAVANNDVMGLINGMGYDGTTYGLGSAIYFTASEGWTGSAHGGALRFLTAPNGTTTLTEKVRIAQNGFTGILTSTPQTTFEVAGSVRSTGRNVPSGGQGAELFFQSGQGYIESFDRTAASSLPFTITGSTVTLAGTSGSVIVGSGGLTVNGGLNVVGGNIGIEVAQSYLINGVSTLAVQSGFTVVRDTSGTNVLTLGNSDPTNYYNNTTHSFRNRAASAVYATIGSGGLNLTSGGISVAGSTILSASSGYTFVNDATGNGTLMMGSSDPNNYYRNGSHIFQNRGATVNYGTWGSGGLTVNPAAAGGFAITQSGLTNGQYVYQIMGKSGSANEGFIMLANYHSTDANRYLSIGTLEGWNTNEQIALIGTGYVSIGAGNAASNRLVLGDDVQGAIGAAPGNALAIGNASGPAAFSIGQGASNRGRMTWVYNATPSSAYWVIGTAGGSNPLILQDAGGFVGIGVNPPQARLDVNGSINISASYQIGLANVMGSASGSTFLNDPSGAGTVGQILIGPSGSPNITYGNTTHTFKSRDQTVTFAQISVNGLQLYGSSNSLRMAFNDSTANLGYLICQGNLFRFASSLATGSADVFKIGANDSGNIYLINGTGYKPGGGTWADISDVRTKKNVLDYTTGLAAVTRLRPVSFQHNGRGGSRDDGKSYVGLVADEARLVMPEMVSLTHEKLDPGDDHLTEMFTLESSALTYALVNSVKELAARVAALEAVRPAA